jgi:hypothetical protein
MATFHDLTLFSCFLHIHFIHVFLYSGTIYWTVVAYFAFLFIWMFVCLCVCLASSTTTVILLLTVSLHPSWKQVRGGVCEVSSNRRATQTQQIRFDFLHWLPCLFIADYRQLRKLYRHICYCWHGKVTEYMSGYCSWLRKINFLNNLTV